MKEQIAEEVGEEAAEQVQFVGFSIDDNGVVNYFAKLKDSNDTYYEKLAEKRERMITGEVESTSDLLHLNLKEMLDCRIKMCEDIKEVFGVDLEVKTHLDLDADGTIENEKEFERGENNV